jgi:hypothetical protein
MKNNFKIFEAISFGWSTFKSNWKFWIVIFVLSAGALGGASGGMRSAVGGVGQGLRQFGRSVPLKTGFPKPAETIDFKNYPIPTPEMFMDLEDEDINDIEDSPFVMGDSDFVDVFNKERDPLSYVFIFLAIFYFVGLIVFGILFGLVNFLARYVIEMGKLNVLLDSARGKEVYYKTLLNQVSLKKAIRLLVTSMLSSIIIFFGFLVFIIPGIYFALKYAFVSYVIVDEDCKPGEALKRSSQITKGNRFKLLMFFIVLGFLQILGILFFGFGVIATSIVASLATAYVFTKLKDEVAQPVVTESPEPAPEPAVDTEFHTDPTPVLQ